MKRCVSEVTLMAEGLLTEEKTLRVQLETELGHMGAIDKNQLIKNNDVNSYFLFLLECTDEEVSQETMLEIKNTIIDLGLNVVYWKQ